MNIFIPPKIVFHETLQAVYFHTQSLALVISIAFYYKVLQSKNHFALAI